MPLSSESKLLCGITLLAVPTILYGGITLLGVLTQGAAGLPPGAVELNETQFALWRAGHAHAGVWVILSLVLQLLLDATRLPAAMRWTARIAAPVAAVTVSGGFFGLAFADGFRWMLYTGGLLLVLAVLITAIGLLRNLGSDNQ